MKAKLNPDELNKNDKLFILIGLFIKPSTRESWVSSDYPKERMAAKRLMNSYSDFQFFYSLTEYNERFNSLLGFIGKKMKAILDDKYQSFLCKKKILSQTSGTKLEDKPVIELEQFESKPKKAKNLMELIDNM